MDKKGQIFDLTKEWIVWIVKAIVFFVVALPGVAFVDSVAVALAAASAFALQLFSAHPFF